MGLVYNVNVKCKYKKMKIKIIENEKETELEFTMDEVEDVRFKESIDIIKSLFTE